MHFLDENIQIKIDKFYKKNSLDKNRVIVAFSGGADSTALLLNLKYYLSNNVIAFYFAHFIRSDNEQNQEIEHVKGFCDLYNIALQIKKCDIDIKSESARLGVSIEELARKFRYIALENALKENGANYIALAHNENDQIETIIMRFFQGSFLDGLSGIPSVNRNIIRPLLEVSRLEIENFLSLNNIGFFVDSTNAQNLYLRNRVRNNLLPAIKKVFKGYEKCLKRISEFSKEFADYFGKDEFFPVEKGKYYYSFDLKTFLDFPKYLVFRLIFKILNSEGIAAKVSYKALNEAFKVEINRKKNNVLLKTNDFFLEKRHNKINLIFKRDEKFYKPFDFILEVGKWHSLSLGKILLKYLECNAASVSRLKCCSYEFRYKFFKDRLKAKKFFSKFIRCNPAYLMLLALDNRLIGIIDLNTLNLVWSEKSILKKINISLIGGLLKE
ncbi:tRNA lysidine(34) synthetase TilS [Borreliella burgdorferi]|uniref:tRNA(Ile)-lysidine synthase n=4 Tax=Borreliella burgdorferi TaxID=139 RepID=TILS_BORBU|nr:tRNA lysidine(34) synthetase TilS [Borreliella burgdorferi]B7J0N4.1 RecName: Full=tRNA(Ile)-lysidine synthase; AltName: Full=tRNA(Ile)-2-lysyl-cytidine synthase; AltName: Full=tRNA(Ile)-lysidine synthetase [Borreliella burgdorferi ZS7]O51728.1 RecName: Full=tRNA(Ile)-lysidine synthase; AltName: Full=tRNA(Ile)-2-lysyl-cytidine synthase; AltName: Full=tRNA(Ile)-lysidine synthetase [Borreliella burgdorferi B31]AGS66784.1 cell cycle protein [Borreliella burgdorferi CA382]AAC67121.1 tRNA(Ile)-lys